MSEASIVIAANTDNGYWQTFNTFYPPTTFDGEGDHVANAYSVIRKMKSGANYLTSTGFLRFDTSVIPDSAVDISAALLVDLNNFDTNDDNRSINLEWYPWTTSTSADYAELVSTTAGVIAPVDWEDFNEVVSWDLTDAEANINLTGYTGIRMGMDGGVPSGDTQTAIANRQNALRQPARLLVTYSGEDLPSTAEINWYVG